MLSRNPTRLHVRFEKPQVWIADLRNAAVFGQPCPTAGGEQHLQSALSARSTDAHANVSADGGIAPHTGRA